MTELNPQRGVSIPLPFALSQVTRLPEKHTSDLTHLLMVPNFALSSFAFPDHQTLHVNKCMCACVDFRKFLEIGSWKSFKKKNHLIHCRLLMGR